MAASNRKIIKKLYAKLAKRYTAYPADCLDKNRDILEHLVYAIFLENASFEAANQCFSVLESYFVDWNEVRVSTAYELAEVFASVYEPERTGERIRRTLQYIFESLYKFDLEEFRARGPAETFDYLQSIPYSTDFVKSYTVNFVFKMQDIPLDEGALRVLRLLDIVQVNEKNREEVEGLASPFTQAERLDFFRGLHMLGLEMLDDSRRPNAIKFIKEIDDKADQRSWIPLVDLSEITDPVLIARQLSRKEHKTKLPLALALDEESEVEIIDDPIVDDLLDPTEEVVTEDEPFIEVCLESRTDLLVENSVGAQDELGRKKSAAKRARGESAKSTETPTGKKSSEKKTASSKASASKTRKSDVPVSTPSKKEKQSESRPAREDSPGKAESKRKKSVKKSSESSDKKKSSVSDRRGKGTQTVSDSKSVRSAKVSDKASTASRRDKSSTGEKAAAKLSGKSAAGPVKRATPSPAGKKSSSSSKVASGKKADKSANPSSAKRKTGSRSDTSKKGPVKSDEAKKTSVKKGGAKTDGAKKDGPKQVADKTRKVSAAKKLLQKKPH